MRAHAVAAVPKPGATDVEGRELTEEERIAQARQEVTRRIKSLGAAGKLRAAVAELAGLARLGVQPDTQAATALLSACASRGDMELASTVFEELFGGFLQPDEVTFAVLLRGYGGKNPPQWEAIDAVLTRMKNGYGMQPTAVSFNALLEVCMRTNDLDRGMDVIDRMAAEGATPNEFTEGILSRKRALRSYLKKAF